MTITIRSLSALLRFVTNVKSLCNLESVKKEKRGWNENKIR